MRAVSSRRAQAGLKELITKAERIEEINRTASEQFAELKRRMDPRFALLHKETIIFLDDVLALTKRTLSQQVKYLRAIQARQGRRPGTQ